MDLAELLRKDSGGTQVIFGARRFVAAAGFRAQTSTIRRGAAREAADHRRYRSSLQLTRRFRGFELGLQCRP